MAMNPKTAAVVEAVRAYETGKTIVPAILSWAFGRAHVPPAMRKAKALGLVEVAWRCDGTPTYRRTEVA